MVGDDEGLDTEHLVLPASQTLVHLLIPRLQRVEHSARFEPPGTRLHKLQSPQVSLQLNSPKYWQESMVLAAVKAPALIEADKSEMGEMNSKHLAWPALQVLVHASIPLAQ